jgi:hypothetical protein
VRKHVGAPIAPARRVNKPSLHEPLDIMNVSGTAHPAPIVLTLARTEPPEDTDRESGQIVVLGERSQAIAIECQGRPGEFWLAGNGHFYDVFVQKQCYDAKLSDPFYDSLEGLLLDLRTVTMVLP